MLHKYDMMFLRVTGLGGEVFIEELSVNRSRFTSREFKNFVVTELFSIACSGCGYEYIRCDVFCDGVFVLYANAITRFEGSSIFVDVSVARPMYDYTLYRVMTLAK